MLKEVVTILKDKGVNVSGFLSEGIQAAEGHRLGFTLIDIGNEKGIELCSIEDKFGGPKQGNYYFNPAALMKGNEIIADANNGGTGAIVIDEVGPMEISGGGWYTAIEKLCASSIKLQIWTVRRSLAEKAAKRWNTGTVYIIDIGATEPVETAGIILATINKNEGN
jgi:iron complex transport system ATP-binding protein